MSYPLRHLALISLLAASGCVNHSGLLTENHGLEIDDTTVRITLMNFDSLSVFSTGDARNRQGELHWIKTSLSAPSEYNSRKFRAYIDIFNVSKGQRGNAAYVPIDVQDHLELYDGDRRVHSERPRKPDLWINARRGARFEINVTTRELDCSQTRVCNRGNTGNTVYVMTLPDLPATLPLTCRPENTFESAVLDGRFVFHGVHEFVRSTSGSPVLEPEVFATNVRLCITAAS